ncbi:Glycosyltransferase, GT2 family [Mycolicibacterium rutilum]|uniref:Glycosyltransferase, GT2 family n=2 Tax=Mycolicibacterium rutilum TaxID=370526 RepID=A0A1H6JU11_MYCRU|nr:Glycosyltransferase, GT2 family [Mycolicibacterium rutilum]
MPTMTKHMPVVAAIPNYNMGHHLRLLLPQVLERGYDRVFVLDDGSTDDSVEVVNSFNGAVRLVRAPQNQGCTANRNQIIDHVGDEELIHFIDADMDLPTPEAAAVARDVAARYADRGVGAIGGLVSRVDGSQEPYNYGPVFSLKTIVTLVPPLLDRVKDRPLLTRAVRLLGKPAEKKWPNVLEPPRPAEAYWLHEGNMLIFSSVFKAIGGYDPKMRNHGAQDLAIRLEKHGVKRYFDPSIEVVHHYIDVRGKKRRRQQYESIRYMIDKHGYGFLLSGR